MDRYLKQLPTGWVKSDRGYIVRHDDGSSCEIFKDGKIWIAVNISDGTLASGRWANWYPSFKQALAAILAG